MSFEDEFDISLASIFPEPPRPPSPEPTFATYKRRGHDQQQNHDSPLQAETLELEDDRGDVEIRLVGTHPLWGHHLWNAARAFASYLDTHPELSRGRSVLELGAGGGLPGIVAAMNGARHVTLTDYPDAALIDNLAHNVVRNVPPGQREHVRVQGYIWGHPADPLLAPLPDDHRSGFDIIIMSDLIFNHSQHIALLNTCDMALAHPTPPPPASSTAPAEARSTPPCILVFYTHHRPHLAHLDLQFFETARARGWSCEEILTHRFPPMFPDDPGEEEVRATVHGWRLSRSRF